ncbi:MAG TPA: hypothetical protein VME92_02110 [Acetobacteraceae bacterium]|nr:hypothetical protein [Acetobacteraceae bacterium]
MAPGLPDRLARLLDRPDLAAIFRDVSVRAEPGLGAAFVVPGPGLVLLDSALGNAGSEATVLVTLRHAGELACWTELCPDRPALAGLAAARVAAAYGALLGAAPAPESALVALGGSAPDAPALARLWSRLARHAPHCADPLPADTHAMLAQLWPLLAPAERLMQTGGDVRLRVDPRTGLNGYGCSHAPRPWAVTFASSTASSSSERGYAAAEAARRRLLQSALAGRDGVTAELALVREDLARFYGVPAGGAVVLAASGTDAELLALTLALRHPGGRPVSNILIAPEETGSGVPLAAAGRHFAVDTACGVAVPRGAPVEGLRADTEIAAVPLRAAGGGLRLGTAIEADCAAIAAAAIAAGRRPLLHLLDVSKTGLLAPSVAAMQALHARHGESLDVVVDACQARLGPARVAAYLESGWMVLVTGSKFFTGPPFCGAVLLPPAIATRLPGEALPRGLHAYTARPDWPDDAPAARGLDPAGNLGCALRWQAALAEMHAFAAIAPAERLAILQSFTGRVGAAIAANPDLLPVTVPPLRRPPTDDAWDETGTILSFALRRPDTGARLDVGPARQVYHWLNADLAPALADLATAERALAARRFHIGQPVPLRDTAGPFGALRVSAGARLVSGEPSLAHLPPAERLEREIADACAVLAKISLILRQFERLQAIDPAPTFL